MTRKPPKPIEAWVPVDNYGHVLERWIHLSRREVAAELHEKAAGLVEDGILRIVRVRIVPVKAKRRKP